MSYILRTTDISKKYNSHSNQDVLKTTQFSIQKGAIYVIEGKSGSGKSTFLSILGGMEKPTQGKVYYKNESLYDLNDREQAKIRGEKFGFVFQSFQLINESLEEKAFEQYGEHTGILTGIDETKNTLQKKALKVGEFQLVNSKPPIKQRI
ncbi:ATP-binding cassette domain-containing protein [Bacillota bacterium Lsc_1132]